MISYISFVACACCIEISHFVNVAKRDVTSVLFSVWFNDFAGFYWSYMFLLLMIFPCLNKDDHIIKVCGGKFTKSSHHSHQSQLHSTGPRLV